MTTKPSGAHSARRAPPARRPYRAAGARFGTWRRAAKLTFAEAGKLFGVSAVNCRAWELGQKRPAAGPRRAAVATITKIPAKAWENANERALGARVEAHVATSAGRAGPVRARGRRSKALDEAPDQLTG